MSTTEHFETPSLEVFLTAYAQAPAALKTAAIRTAAGILRGANSTNSGPWLSLRELSSALGFRAPSTLFRLGIHNAAVRFAGGARRYRLEDAVTYLNSPRALAAREQLRQRRRAQFQKGAK